MLGARYTIDSDGDVEMSVPQPIFEVIRPPELTSWEHAALVECHREWERYVDKIRHRCVITGETFENVVGTVKGSVRRKTLTNLAKYVLKKAVDAVTDDDIMNAVKARCQSLKNAFVPDVTSLFRQKFKMNLSIDDCDARIFRYYEDFNGIVEDNGLQGLIGSDNEVDAGYKSRMKARCRLLVENLQPPVLKAQISRLIDLERRDCKSDDVALFDLILEHAKVQQWFHKISSDYGTKTDDKSPGQSRKPQKPGGGSKAEPPRTTPPAAASSASTSASTRPARLPPHDGCLFCKGSHWLADCPRATDAQREEDQRKYREAKDHRSASMRTKSARYAKNAGTVRINGLAEVAYLPDTGADQSMVPQETVNSLRAMQPSLQVAELASAVEATMADGRVQLCAQEVLLDLELTTMAGLVSLRAVPCLIVPGDGDEFLLGHDVLKGLGIDVDKQLAQLAGQPLLDSEIDEFPVGDAITEPQAAHASTQSTIQLLERAIANGLPAEHLGTLREILEAYPEVWSDEVGPGPPANVEPLQVTLQPDAVPYRTPPRKYALLQAQFIRDYVKSLVDNGLVEQNNASRWACAVVPERKPGAQDEFRLTIDYRPVNRMTVPIAGTMPSVATTSDAFKGKKVFGRVDFTKGFWQLPLHEASREVFSFTTPDGVFTPARVPQGAMDSALHFQGQIQTKLAPLIPHSALVWVDDVILFAPTVEEFLVTLGVFFKIVVEANSSSIWLSRRCLSWRYCGAGGLYLARVFVMTPPESAL
ncbi:hypothetical protein PI126_g2564 [Phytophthora idaei]|nr:hypothetical protein PI126_g2564 [Phytophthora idaei]